MRAAFVQCCNGCCTKWVCVWRYRCCRIVWTCRSQTCLRCRVFELRRADCADRRKTVQCDTCWCAGKTITAPSTGQAACRTGSWFHVCSILGNIVAACRRFDIRRVFAAFFRRHAGCVSRLRGGRFFTGRRFNVRCRFAGAFACSGLYGRFICNCLCERWRFNEFAGCQQRVRIYNRTVSQRHSRWQFRVHRCVVIFQNQNAAVFKRQDQVIASLCSGRGRIGVEAKLVFMAWLDIFFHDLAGWRFIEREHVLAL